MLMSPKANVSLEFYGSGKKQNAVAENVPVARISVPILKKNAANRPQQLSSQKVLMSSNLKHDLTSAKNMVFRTKK